MMFMPPRHGKSECVTVRYPVWRLLGRPEQRVIIGAYNHELAIEFSGRARNLAVECGLVQAGSAASHDWRTAASGGVRAVGVGSGVTGRGANLIIIDDPVKSREEAESEAYRRRVWNWYKDDLYTRLEPNGAMILIQTRWHEADLAGRILAEAENGGEQWDVVSLPALAEADDPMGRAPGAALCPERFDETALARIRSVLGSYSFAALYQQRPTPAEGALFKRDWFRIVDRAPDGLTWYRYWDLAASTHDYADYTASAAVALGDDGVFYVRDMVRGRWEWPDAYNVIVRTMLAEPSTVHGIEKAMHGLAALQQLQRDRRIAHITLSGVTVDRDKVSRAMPWASRAESGKVALVGGVWVNEFLSEVCAFPLGAHDDQVDTVSGAISHLIPSSDIILAPSLWN
jgi:predicted phage terminase large subunit-like protein